MVHAGYTALNFCGSCPLIFPLLPQPFRVLPKSQNFTTNVRSKKEVELCASVESQAVGPAFQNHLLSTLASIIFHLVSPEILQQIIQRGTHPSMRGVREWKRTLP